jgi:hypothetical protein
MIVPDLRANGPVDSAMAEMQRLVDKYPDGFQDRHSAVAGRI